MKQKKLLFSLLLLFLSTFLFAQQIKVRGTVIDDTGYKLSGANVLIKGMKIGTSTGVNGSYEIEATKGQVLQFSYLGFKSEEQTVSGTIMNVKLKSDAKQLEGVVVTAFGVQSKSKSLGYANQTIKSADVERPGQVNALESLQGSVAGVAINRTSGAAGAGVDILIRGVSSLNGGNNNQPLIVIDGNIVNNATFSGNVGPSAGSNSQSSAEQFAFSNRAIDINPNDIESYSVLKGAGATALYGILAGNGVIIITTKKGKVGKTRINVSSSTSFSDVNKFPELQSRWREGQTIGGVPKPGVLSNNANVPGGVTFYPGFSFGFQSSGPEYSSNDDPSIKFRNFYKDFFKTGVNQMVNVSISGANERFNYFMSGSYSKDVGIVPNTNYDKKTFKVSGSFQVTEKFKIGSSVTYANSGGARANTGDKSIMSSMSYWSPSIDINDYLTADGNQKNWTTGIVDNPRYFAEVSNQNSNVDRWIASGDFSWQPKPWLNLVYRASVDNFAETRNRYVPGDLDVGTQVGGFIVNENLNFSGLNSNLLLTANKKFDKISTTLTIGNQIAQTKSNYGFIRGEKLLISGFNNIANTTNKFAGYPGEEIQRTVGYFAEAKADYDEKLFLSATARRDKVSTLPLDNNGFNYFSGNAAFIFNEYLDKNQSILSFGKLRASWAQVGKIPPYGVSKRYAYPQLPFAGVGGIAISSVDGNPNIKPEIVTTKEVGVDLKFLKNRIRIDYTYFNRLSDNQILPFTPSPASSLTTVWDNAGSLVTKGHELLVEFNIIKNESFNWTSTFNFSANTSEVLSLPFEKIVFADSGQGVVSQIKVGDAIGSIYGYTWTYINGQRLIGTNGLPVLKRAPNGDIAVEKIANAFPDWIGSVNNNLKYKNFNLSFLLEYKKGGSAFDAGQRNGIRNGNLKITEERNITQVLEGVKADGTPNNIPLLINGPNYFRNTNYNLASEILVQDASWVKLRNVSLSYDLSPKVTSKIGIDSATFTVSGGNFLLWTPFRGFDPEGNQYSAGSNTYGFTGLNVPLTQSYSFGINLGL
jgi:TonB-linked SusC/RagA family outer membrane protein